MPERKKKHGRLDSEAQARASEVGRRVDALRALLERRGAAAVLLRTRRNFCWLTVGGVNHVVLESELGEAPLLVTRDRAVILAPVIEAARIADEEVHGLGIEVESFPWYEASAIADGARELAGGAEPLADADLEEELIPVRSVLSPLEQQRMAWLGQQTARALVAALDQATPGETEDTVAAAAVGALARDGIRAPVVLAAADERIERYRHPLPSAAIVARRLMLVLVAERWGLHAAVTRIRDFLPASEDLDRRVAAVNRVEAAMHDATSLGVTLGDVFRVAQEAYAREGFPDEWQRHHQGGTIGYQGRERVASPGDAMRIKAGMAFAWNPSITGAKAEDTFILGADGSRRIVTGSTGASTPP